MLKDLKSSRQAGSPEKKTAEIACEKDKSWRFNSPPAAFKTVDSRNEINYKGQDIAKTSTRCNLGKLRELLSLPFCGFHYQPATIDKFFRELKYQDDFSRDFADENVNLVIVGDREVKPVRLKQIVLGQTKSVTDAQGRAHC